MSRSLQQRHGSVVACCSIGGTECSSACMGPFEESPIVFITSTIVWPQVNNREGTQLYPSTENWIKDLLSMPPPIRIRPSFPLSESLPSGSFHKPLILLHQRADRLKTTITESGTIWSQGPQSCLTQWNYEPCHVGPPKSDWSWWRVLTKHGPLEKGMANHFSSRALRTPWTVWKVKKVGHWKRNSRLVGAQYATGDQSRNNSRKNEGMEPKQKQHPVVDVTGDRKSYAVKSNIT